VYQHDSGYEAIRHPDGSARTVQRPSHFGCFVGSFVAQFERRHRSQQLANGILLT
jgi:hypothetical protein